MTQKLTKDDLRGCPFCAGEGEIEEIKSGCFGVGCHDCDFQLMTGPVGLGWHKSVSDAVGAWNERHSDLCIEQLQNWTKDLQAKLEAANKQISEFEQGKCLHQIAEPAAYPHLPHSVADVVDFMDGRGVNVDFSHPAPAGGTSLYTAAQMRAYVDADRAQRAAAPQAAVPLPLLVRDIARELGITVPQACTALKPLGNYSTNAAVTAEMARMLREAFPAPAHPADGVPAPMERSKARIAELESVLAHVQEEFKKFGNSFPDGFDWRLFRFVDDTLAGTRPTQQGLDAKRFLSESDHEDLWRFEGMASDGEGYDISKDRMRRLAELGVVRWCGKDRYCMTAFGQYVLKAWDRLPLETYEESNARCNAEFKARIDRLNADALAAQAKQGGANA